MSTVSNKDEEKSYIIYKRFTKLNLPKGMDKNHDKFIVKVVKHIKYLEIIKEMNKC